MRQNSGFTIIELMISTVVLLLLLGAAAAFLSQGSRSHSIVIERSSEQELLDSVSQILQYDFRLAGYQGNDAPPAPISQAITPTPYGVRINYTLSADPERPHETPGAQAVIYEIQDGTLTRCLSPGATPGACRGGLTELASGMIDMTVDTETLDGHGVNVTLYRTPYTCYTPDCVTPHTVRILFPQPLPTTGDPQ